MRGYMHLELTVFGRGIVRKRARLAWVDGLHGSWVSVRMVARPDARLGFGSFLAFVARLNMLNSVT